MAINVSIILLNYNNAVLTLNCINSIFEKTPKTISFEIIVVDNASKYEDYEQLESGIEALNLPNISLHRSRINTGFAAGNMHGVQFAKGEFIALINNDVILVEDSFSPLIQYLNDHKDTGAIGLQPTYEEGDKQVAFSHFDTFSKTFLGYWLYETLHPKKAKRHGDYKSPIVVDFVVGSFMFFRVTGDKSALKKANKYLKIELDSCAKADKIIVISEQDKKSLGEYYKDDSKVLVLSNIHQKIDRDFPGFSNRKDILFIGGFFHSPNVDCVFYLHNEIMPLVWKVLPSLSVQIVGSNPTEELLALNSEQFQIIGYVESVNSYFLNSRLFVAPLRYGAGIKGKIGQSLEFGLPLVTTEIGAEGFDFGTYKNAMIGSNSAELAEKIIALYQDEALWNNIKEHTAEIIAPFSIKATESKMLKLFE